jgi:AcrR family transcriptional regulator
MARPKGDIDSRILHAARARFLVEGVDAASLRAVARDAGTSIGMIYYYFPTKEDLFLGVVEEVYQRVLRDIEAALAPTVPVAERILRLYTRIDGLDRDELDVLRLIVREALTSSERRERLFERFSRGHFPVVVRTILEGLGDGTLNADLHPLVVISAVVALGALPPVIVRTVAAHLPLPGAAPPPNLPKQLVYALLEGVGRPENGGAPARTTSPRSPPKSGRAAPTLKTRPRKKVRAR